MLELRLSTKNAARRFAPLRSTMRGALRPLKVILASARKTVGHVGPPLSLREERKSLRPAAHDRERVGPSSLREHVRTYAGRHVNRENVCQE